MAGSTASGIALAAAAALAFEVSYVLQALEARRTDAGGAPSPRVLARLARRPRWIAAIALSLVAVALQVLALRQAPLSLVQPVLALGLVLLLVLGRVVLGDRAGARELAGAAGVIAGVALLVAGAPERGGDGSGAALAVACVVLGAITLAPFALRVRAAGALVAAAACADALAAVALNEAAGATTPLRAILVAWAALAAGAGLMALAAESAALARTTVARVGPPVLGGQIAIPVALAPLVAGDRWSSPGLVVAGLVLVVGAVVLLAASPAVARIRHPGEA